MKQNTYTMCLLLAVGLAGFGCGGAAEESPKKAEEPTIEYPTAESGATTTVEIEGYFQITQPDDTSGELRWLFQEPPDEALLKIISEQFDGPEGEEGGPGTRVWLFQAIAAGATEFTLEFFRPWEEDAGPAKSAIYKIVIEDKPAEEEEEPEE